MNEKNIFQQILENSKSHIDKSLYTYLFMLVKYIFFGNKGIKNKEMEKKIIIKLKNMTESINNSLIKIKTNFIKYEPVIDAYSIHNFNNIINFIKMQNSMFAGDIIEAILIMIFSFGFETDKTNEFGKYIYVNISKLRDTTYHDLSDWFKKGEKIFLPNELRNFRALLLNDVYLGDLENKNKMNEDDETILKELITTITKYKFNFITYNEGKSKTFEYINNGKLDLIKFFLDKFADMKNNTTNLTMVDKDFTSNSLAFIYYYLFVEQNLTPIRMIRCFLTSVYIFYQNEHSPLMQYIDPKPKDIENKEEDKEDLVVIPFTYTLRGAFVEGRFSNTIISPIKLEPKISSVNLGQNNIREWGLFELGKSITMNSNIKSITLKISLLRGYYLDFFVSGLGIYDNYSVEDLNLSMNYLKEESAFSLVKLISHFKNLKTLNLSANDLKGGPKHILIYLKKQFRLGKSKLENLYLNNCTMDESAFYELGELVKSRCCKLKRLSVGGNNKSNTVNFLKQVKYNRNLEELYIFKCGFKNEDIDDILRIISNTNIKHLNLFKNDFKNFGKCLSIVYRTKLIKNNGYFIDRSASLMTLDLSNNAFDLINSDHINLINKIVEDNSTLSCLDLSHIVYGQYPDRSKSPKSDNYKIAVSNTLMGTLKQRKEKFSNLLFDKFKKEVSINDYKKKDENDKLKYRSEELDKRIKEILKEEDAKLYLFLREKCKEMIKDFENEKIGDKNLYDYLLEKETKDSEDYTKEEQIQKKIIEYMEYLRDKKDLDDFNYQLGEKNLVLI